MGGPYRILGRIGSGGMAEVYLAKAIGAAGFEKEVAIKSILPVYTSDPRLTVMLIEEAKIANRLNHANIVQVLDLGQAGERYFIVMEYIDGADLDRTLKHARLVGVPLPVELACGICRQVLCALGFVHEREDQAGAKLHLVHRDVSPPNILLSRAGEVKLADFGIAKVRSKALQTAAGVIRGKAGYMSPEQAMGASLDQRSDLFSLGVVLFEMLTGGELFSGDNQIELLRKVREAQVIPPSKTKPGLPKILDQVVLRALAKDPDHRYANARAFDLALEQAMQEAKLSASPAGLAGWLERALPPRRLQPLPAVGDTLVFESLSAHPDAAKGTRPIFVSGSLPVKPEIPGAPGPRFRLLVASLGLSLGVMGLIGVWLGVRGGRSDGAQTPDPVKARQDPDVRITRNNALSGAWLDAGGVDGGVPADRPAGGLAGPEPAGSSGVVEVPKGEGTVYFNSEPWAQIIVDGKDTGFTTPTVDGLRIAVGRHVITLINPKLELSRTVEMVVEKDQVIKRFFDLRRDGIQH